MKTSKQASVRIDDDGNDLDYPGVTCIALASKPCERKGKPGVVCAMTPSPVRYCATCAARIAIGNEGLEQVKQARSALPPMEGSAS